MPDGRLADTIAVPDAPRFGDSFSLANASGYDRPFSREQVSTMTGAGLLAVGDNGSYAIDLLRDGKPVVRIEREFTPIAIDGAERTEWQAWARHMEAVARRNGTSKAVGMVPKVATFGDRAVSYPIPRTKPPFSEFRSDSDGRLWVRRYVVAEPRPGPERAKGDPRPRRVWRERPTYDVFESDGRFLGTLVLPWDSFPLDAAGPLVWLVVEGELGEEIVVQYRITPGTR
jgi:hypothetical protein